MDDMQVYIANLGKYNEGELVGAWFTFPIDFEEVKEKIGLNDEYEEYAIHDYELPFTVDEYTPIGELNRLWEMVDRTYPEYITGSELSALQSSLWQASKNSASIKTILSCHSGCDDMADVARCYHGRKRAALGELPATLTKLYRLSSLWAGHGPCREPLSQPTTAIYEIVYGRPVGISLGYWRIFYSTGRLNQLPLSFMKGLTT